MPSEPAKVQRAMFCSRRDGSLFLSVAWERLSQLDVFAAVSLRDIAPATPAGQTDTTNLPDQTQASAGTRV